MEVADLVRDIVFGAIGLLVLFFLANWFKTVNNTQKEQGDELKKNAIKHIINEKDNERIDEDLMEGKKANERAAQKFYKNANDLAKSMSNLADSQKDNHILIKENLLMIKQNSHRITNLEDGNQFIVKEIIKRGRIG